MLIRAAFSSNIKERRDCSTALFDAAGRMVVQAEHIPVHLGAMPEAVAAVMARRPADGEVWALNDPYTGGTHLPDITLVSRTVLGFAVSRAHHADVGGMEPASLPANSRELYQEGLIIPPTRLDDGLARPDRGQLAQPRRAAWRPPSPARRAPARRRTDRRARRAAWPGTGRGGDGRAPRLLRAPRAGRHRRACRMDATRRGRGRGGRGRPRDPRRRDDRRRRGRDRLRGHGAAVSGQPELPSRRHALGVLLRRSPVTDPDIPACGGAFAPVSVRAPRGLPRQRACPRRGRGRQHRDVEPDHRRRHGGVRTGGGGAAQRAGNDEQHDVRYEPWAYYETIGGGQGASPHSDGPSAVHVAMSNALNTPVEALELAYPLRVERYALRLGSGGAGRQRGGDGVVREIRALEDCRLSVLGDRRRHAPPGTRGGEPGARGRTLLNGNEIPGKDTRGLAAGDVVRTETPGRRRLRAGRADPVALGDMCRNIRTLHNFDPPATEDEVPRGGAAVRSQDQRHREAVESERSGVHAGRRRDRPRLASSARRPRHDGSPARSRARGSPARARAAQRFGARPPAAGSGNRAPPETAGPARGVGCRIPDQCAGSGGSGRSHSGSARKRGNRAPGAAIEPTAASCGDPYYRASPRRTLRSSPSPRRRWLCSPQQTLRCYAGSSSPTQHLRQPWPPPPRPGPPLVRRAAKAPKRKRAECTRSRVVTGPINPKVPGLTTFRGNLTRSYYGAGPVPRRAPRILWRYPRTGRMCSLSTDETGRHTWCGIGWTGQPNVIPHSRGRVELRFGAYDRGYHFLDATTGRCCGRRC